MMLRLSYKLICVLLTFTGGVTATQLKRSSFAASASAAAALIDAAPQESHPAPKEGAPTSDTDAERPADYLIAENKWTYEGFTIENQARKAPVDDGQKPKASPLWVNVNYVVVKKAGKILGRFDADVYFGLGNSASFGMFPFLGGGKQQLFISQGVPRGGCQWVVNLSPGFRIIFDGAKYAVGREGDDLAARDLDRDGVYEVIVPITDFYALQDKMSISDIPLPEIIFKFDPIKEAYLPANSLFRDYVSHGLVDVPKVMDARDLNFPHRSAVISNLLIYVYAGDERAGWDVYDMSYSLDDKEEVRRRIKSILRNQPVYKFIYNHHREK
jgi:hypothetical protein